MGQYLNDEDRFPSYFEVHQGAGEPPFSISGNESNNVGSQQQGQGQLEACYGCRLATYSSEGQPNSRARANLRHAMGVGWQPTAVKDNNVGSKQQGQGQLEACYGCRLATYSSEGQQCRVQTAGPGPTCGMLWV